MNRHTYKGPLKNHLQNYVNLRQAMGCKFNEEARNLKHLDRFILEKHPLIAGLTKEIVLTWCSKKTYETQATRYKRATLMRKFGIYSY